MDIDDGRHRDERTVSGLHIGKSEYEYRGWESNFVEQTGRNVNVAINGIAKLLVMLSQ
jgi:hypothetical protein